MFLLFFSPTLGLKKRNNIHTQRETTKPFLSPNILMRTLGWYYQERRNERVGVWCSSTIQHLPGICKVLGSIPGPTLPKKKKEKKKAFRYQKYLSAITGCFKIKCPNIKLCIVFLSKKVLWSQRKININLETWVRSPVLSVLWDTKPRATWL